MVKKKSTIKKVKAKFETHSNKQSQKIPTLPVTNTKQLKKMRNPSETIKVDSSTVEYDMESSTSNKMGKLRPLFIIPQ